MHSKFASKHSNLFFATNSLDILKVVFNCHSQCDVPDSFVCTVREMLNGPVPALVSAAITQTYVVNGLSDCMTRLVVAEDTWKVSPVSISVTFMR